MSRVLNCWLKVDKKTNIKLIQPKYLPQKERTLPREGKPNILTWSNLLYSQLVDQVMPLEEAFVVITQKSGLGNIKTMYEINLVASEEGYPQSFKYLQTPDFSIIEFSKGYYSPDFRDEILNLVLTNNKLGMYVVFKEGEKCTNAYQITKFPERNMLNIKHFAGRWLICQREQSYDTVNKVFLKPSTPLELLNPSSLWATEDFLENLPD